MYGHKGKWTGIIGIAVIAAVAAAVIIARKPAGRPPSFAGVFPEGALVFVELKNGRGLVADMAGSKAWRALSRTRGFRRQFVGARAGDDGPDRLLQTLAAVLGDETAAAFYGTEGPEGSGILLACRSIEKSREESIITALGSSRVGSYGGRTIYSVTFPRDSSLRGFFTLKDGIFIAAMSTDSTDGLLKAVIDLSDGKRRLPPLSIDARITKAWGFPEWGGGEALARVFVDWRGIEMQLPGFPVETLKTGLRGLPSPLVDRISGGTANPVPGRLWTLAQVRRDKGIVARVRTVFDPSAMTERQKSRILARAGGLETIDLVPRDSLFLITCRAADPALLLETPPIAVPLSWLRDAAGIDPGRDILPWLGNEASVFLSDLLTGGLFPLPRIGVVAEAADGDAAAASAASVMAGFSPPPSATPRPWDFLLPGLQSGDYRGTRVTTLEYPVPGLQPSVAVRGGYLIAGSERSGVLEAIELERGRGESFEEGPLFSGMHRGLPAELNRLIYLDCARAFPLGGRAASWWLAARKFALSDGEAEEAERIEELRGDLPDIAASLGAFRALMIARRTEGDAVDNYYILRVEDIE